MHAFIESILTWQLIISVGVIVVIIHLLLGLAGMSTYGERKVSAYIQDRIGPNRVGLDLGLPALAFLKGLFGLGQFLADGLKFILKEDYTPRGVDKTLFTLAASIVIVPALIAFAIIPWGGGITLPEVHLLGLTIKQQTVVVAGADLSIGIVYLLAVASLSIYAVVLGGWASNNKYAFLGGLRASAQMISYEIPLGLSILTLLLLTGSLMPEKIISYQASNGWLIGALPVVGVVFYICALAEGNRLPFDNAECEQELVGGYHTEYSAMRMALFMLSEYIHLVTASAFFAVLFLGGYHLPLTWVGAPANHFLSPDFTSDSLLWGIVAVLAKFLVILIKTILMVLFAMLVRWTIPRLKFNQVMGMAWNGIIPLSIGLVVIAAIMIHYGYTGIKWMLPMNLAVGALFLLLAPASTQSTENKRLRIAGSRFFPLVGEPVIAQPTNPMARHDHPGH
ncbi:MAG TPA: NADH-quinone oxidoreductase subunit H [Phycisphaerales bacterium]|nr:NADH-quinone oxidoreductase subunit H [Phycisphaerales bacterium]